MMSETKTTTDEELEILRSSVWSLFLINFKNSTVENVSEQSRRITPVGEAVMILVDVVELKVEFDSG